MDERRTATNRFLGGLSRPAFLLLIFALALRGAVLLFTPDALKADLDGYQAIAENLLANGTFGDPQSPTAWRPPLYPCVLAACLLTGQWSREAVALVHLALGLGTVWLTYWLGKAWGLDRFAWVAAALVACDPILLAASTQLMTETLATFLAAAALACLTRATQTGHVAASGRDANLDLGETEPREDRSIIAVIASGACVGLAILCRPTFLPWAACLAVVLPFAVRSASPSQISEVSKTSEVFGCGSGALRSVTLTLWFVLAVAVVLAPWAVRNQIRFGRPIVTTTHGGYTLLLANNPFFYAYLRNAPWGSVWDGKELERAWSADAAPGTLADEVQKDRAAYAEALATIHNQPRTFLYACLVRVGCLFALIPHQVSLDEGTARRLARYAVGGWYLAEFLLVLGGIGAVTIAGRRRAARAGQRPAPPALGHGSPPLPYPSTGWLFGALLVGCFVAVHSLYWTDMRMRAPLVPVLGLAAAAGLGWIASWRNRRKPLQKNDLKA